MELNGYKHSIDLDDNIQPYAIYAARTIPIPLIDKVKLELERMRALKVIEPVDEPTPWIVIMVVVNKKDGDVRICTDYTKLNKAVKRKIYTMATVENSLARLDGGRIFSKLDCNSGFWQIPNSYRLTSAHEVFNQIDINQVIVHMDDILVFTKYEISHNLILGDVIR